MLHRTKGANMNKLKELIDKLYSINAFISGHYVTKIKKIDYKGICHINELLGEMIKQFREYNEKLTKEDYEINIRKDNKQGHRRSKDIKKVS